MNLIFILSLYSQMDDEENMAILLDFVVIKNMTEAARFVKPVEPEEGSVDSQPDLPRADVKKCLCNCSRFPNINGVFVNEEQPFCYDVTDDAAGTALESLTISDNVLHVDDDDCFTDEDAFDGDDDDCDGHGDDEDAVEDDDEDSHDDQKQRTEDICYSEVMRLRGSSFHDNFQIAIKKCQQIRASKNTIPLRLHFEQINLKDENAIVAQAFIDDSWHSLGYIPGKKIAKVSQAMELNQIVEVIIDRIFRQFIFDLGQFRLFVVINIVKKGKWTKDNKNYNYNKYRLF